MFNVLSQISLLAIGLSTLACTILGGVWFALLMPKHYLVAMGRENNPPPPLKGADYAGQMACTLLIVTTSAILLAALKVSGIEEALLFGTLVGVGYLGAMTYMIAINPNFPRPGLYLAINAPYFLLNALMTSVILTFVGR